VASVVLAGTDDERRHQRRGRRVHVHHGAAGEIERAGRREEAAAPHPVSHGGVDREHPHHHEREIRAEAHALDDGAGDDRDGDDGETRGSCRTPTVGAIGDSR
jgi:hypothetical protein